MENKLSIGNLYDKNLNFLIGSGASFGYLPTLSLNVGREAGEFHTIESLGKTWEDAGKDELRAFLFMHYYAECIRPATDVDLLALSPEQLNVFDNYTRFLNTTIQTISRSPSSTRKCNVFTTNYLSLIHI